MNERVPVGTRSFYTISIWIDFEAFFHEILNCHSMLYEWPFGSHLTRKQKYLQIPKGIWRYLVRVFL